MKINKNYLLIGVLAIVVIGSVLLISRQGKSKSEVKNKVRLVKSLEFSVLAKDEKNFLLDVHVPEQTHIPGTDAFIPYNEISLNLDKFPEDKSTPILVYCRTGTMSEEASKEIAGLGYTNVYDLDGGINIYKESNVGVFITPQNRNLGRVIYGDIPTTTFTLTNFGPLPLKITRVSTSCGCTKAEVDKKELGAYEATEIRVSFNPAVHGDATDVGGITRTIYIQTDNPNIPRLTNTITADVIKN
ncbi:MAG: rhodanese protein [uncultured bacterium]|uniref:Rhodanese domain protein n=1 Tax=Candidatus Woesebacteria bacterium GW2011_GWA1_40_43 TaxID=1618553 RepID=A0A0G0SCH4_9BACT|nr:MAG: rhodanese protein [uncultured bacterium]KKR50893.1 MAG: Rhodanese domain protein [Candidatus Woesebacteria bacterium GW2011_GWD2_40_19]KKR62549.1 MAG: Rhodanese domain protein [Candidatus Woesebacteria bacterium GW2011_GWA1_40_43]HAU64950.1 hypothetical protein [Candidatus Woesebacteria bacterium]